MGGIFLAHTDEGERWMSVGSNCGLARQLVVVVALSALSMGMFAEHRRSAGLCSAPIWSAVLIPNVELRRSPHYWEDRENVGITFLDDERILLHYIDMDFGQLSSRQSADVSSPFRLTAILVDGDEGRVLVTREWGTRSGGTAIRVNHGGVFVRTGDTLRLLSDDLVERRKIPIEYDGAEGLIDWDIQVSASRRSVLFNRVRLDNNESKAVSKYYVLDGESFEDREVWEQEPAMRSKAYSVSDNAIAYMKHSANRDQVLIARFGGQNWDAVWKHRSEGCYDSGVFALLTSADFIYACKEFSFVSDGKTQMRQRFDAGERPVSGKVALAENGRFVAISLARIDVRNEDDVMVDHLSRLRLVVYDLALKRRIQELEIVPVPEQHYDFAISPDGSKLAVLKDRTVSVYQVFVLPSEERIEAGGATPYFVSRMRR
jgi:hypothetical protein